MPGPVRIQPARARSKVAERALRDEKGAGCVLDAAVWQGLRVGAADKGDATLGLEDEDLGAFYLELKALTEPRESNLGAVGEVGVR